MTHPLCALGAESARVATLRSHTREAVWLTPLSLGTQSLSLGSIPLTPERTRTCQSRIRGGAAR
jgi:hypothetical protein